MSDADTDDGDELDDELDDNTVGKKTPRPPGPYDQRIGEVVGQLLAAKGWEYPDFVNAVRPAYDGETWNKNRIGRLVRGERRISVTELTDVCRALGVSIKTVFEEAGVIPRGAQRTIPEALMLDPAITDKTRDWLIETYTNIAQPKRATGGRT